MPWYFLLFERSSQGTWQHKLRIFSSNLRESLQNIIARKTKMEGPSFHWSKSKWFERKILQSILGFILYLVSWDKAFHLFCVWKSHSILLSTFSRSYFLSNILNSNVLLNPCILSIVLCITDICLLTSANKY